ncbi:MAG: hypothetical protein QM820_32625 [Minicystis sp.]
MPFVRARAIAALVAAFAATATLSLESHAYKIVCDGSFDVIVCGDGTTIQCLDGVPQYQIDCVDDPIVNGIVCASYGGYVRLDHGDVLTACEYIGDRDFAALASFDDGSGNDPGEIGDATSVCQVGWVGACADGKALWCDDNKSSCDKSAAAIEPLCQASGGVASSGWYLGAPRLTPKNTMPTIASLEARIHELEERLAKCEASPPVAPAAASLATAAKIEP